MKLDVSELQMHISAMVLAERRRQNAMWGVQRHDILRWLSIIVEEVGEVAEATQHGMPNEKATDAGDLLTELIQVAASAQAAAEQVYEEMQRNGH